MAETTKLMRQGQWATRAAPANVAECVELEGFGIIGAVIDTEGNSIILERALAYHDLVDALRDLLPYAEAEAMSLWDCKDSDEAEEAAKVADSRIERAHELISQSF